ncbi:ribosome biogenesis protein brix, putative [Eimeria praecox]|uniref:Ribosome biogenesis protein brix, putative n=1 Tax=Eimeria praecox TaxID=51316 RepID=U6G5P6_9EIME|nr:ribosome biogenesis protein brix, putative [Eimeria praecox]
MGRKGTVVAGLTAPAGVAATAVNAATPAGENSKRAANKRAAGGVAPGADEGAAQGMRTEQLKQRKKPRLQHQKVQQELQLMHAETEIQQDYDHEEKKLQQNGQPEEKQKLHQPRMKRQQPREGRHYKRQELLMNECGEEHSATDCQSHSEGTMSAAIEATPQPTACGAPDSSLGGADTPEGATEADRAAAIDAAAAADPYLLEDADYLRRETRWLNRQRVLLLGSRGISARSRHLIEDFKKLLPHHKCNSVVYLEQRKNDALLHVVKVPLGPTLIARLMNVETLNEVRLSGNCLLYSRPLLIFGAEFDREPHFKVLKELFLQVFGTPRNHPKSKPFFDHVMSFFVADSRIWFRHYQIAPMVMGEGGDANNPHRQTFIEIGPRFVLDPVKILEGSFCGKTLWRNVEFVRTRDLMRPRRLREALDFARRQGQKDKRRLYLESIVESEPKNMLATEDVFGADAVKGKQNQRLHNPRSHS